MGLNDRSIRIEIAEHIIAKCIDIYRAVEALAERGELDDDELILILRATVRIKELALAERNGKDIPRWRTTP